EKMQESLLSCLDAPLMTSTLESRYPGRNGLPVPKARAYKANRQHRCHFICRAAFATSSPMTSDSVWLLQGVLGHEIAVQNIPIVQAVKLPRVGPNLNDPGLCRVKRYWRPDRWQCRLEKAVFVR